MYAYFIVNATYLVVNAAFCVGFLLVCRPLYRIIIRILDEKYTVIRSYIENILRVEEKSELLLNSTIARNNNIEEEVHKVLSKAADKSKAVIEKGQQDIEQTLNEYLDVVAQNISAQVSEVIQNLRINATEIAGDAVTQLVEEYLTDQKHNSDINSTLVYNLSRTLH